MMRRPGLTPIASLALGAVLAVGCRNAVPQPEKSEGATFTRHVAPILLRHCAECHRPDESAPFSLLSYDDARQRARTIVAAVEHRIMPPWLPDDDAAPFAGARRLTSAEINTIRRWVDEGALEGDPVEMPALPHFAAGWRLGTPDLVIGLSSPYKLAAEGGDLWRNFVVSIPVSERRFVRTVEVRPGSKAVHHALIGVDPTRASRRRDASDREPGFEGMDMGDAQSPDGHLLGWTPGMAPFPGVEGRAWALEPDTDLVVQLHLTRTGREESIAPSIGLFFAESPRPAPPLQLLRLDADDSIDIPPGVREFTVSDTFETPVAIDVLAVYPHAHYLATHMEAVAILPGGSERILIRIKSWDFKWQDIYRYATPLSLPRGTRITMRYRFDNSEDNVRNPSRPPRRVVAGLRSIDEMAHLQLQVTTATGGDALALKEAANRHAIAKNPSNPWTWYELGNALRDRGRASEAIDAYRAALARNPRHSAAHNNLGQVLSDEGRFAEAAGHYREAIRYEPDFADAHYNLGHALRALGRLDEARVAFQEALRLEPRHVEAHANLGEVLSAEGRFTDALPHFQEAVRLNQESAEAQNNLGAALGALGRYAEAVDRFRAALAIDPAHARARDNLAIAMERLAESNRRQE